MRKVIRKPLVEEDHLQMPGDSRTWRSLGSSGTLKANTCRSLFTLLPWLTCTHTHKGLVEWSSTGEVQLTCTCVDVHLSLLVGHSVHSVQGSLVSLKVPVLPESLVVLVCRAPQEVQAQCGQRQAGWGHGSGVSCT